MKSNIYNLKDLNDDITEHEESIVSNKESIETNKVSLKNKESEIESATNKKDKLLAQKVDIDDEVEEVNPQTLENEIESLLNDGLGKKESLDDTLKLINVIGEVEFDEDTYNDLIEDKNELKISIGGIEKDIKSKEKLIKEMKEGEICSLCKQPLKDVDHTEQIKQLETEISGKEDELEKENKNLTEITEKITILVETKEKSDKKDKLGLVRDRLEIEMESLRVDMKEKKGILKMYQKNIKSIESNREVDSKILGYNQLLTNLNLERDEINKTITDLENEIKNSEGVIKQNKELIKTIKKETDVLKIYEVYHKMIGKNGISKLVLTSVIPIINYELQRLLDDVCDFELELNMNDKNEVEFLIIKNGVSKKLKSGSGLEATLSSLALRCVLGRISTLPKPNVIVFDEVLGKVADVNLDNVKLFFDKIKTMYDIILFITHNPIAQDWADKIITVVKKNDISSLKLNWLPLGIIIVLLIFIKKGVMNLNLRAYCVIGLGNIKNLTKVLSELSESEVSYVSGTGLIIATFITSLNIVEIENTLNDKEKSYIIFEMTPGFFSANIRDKQFQETLFGGPIENSEFYRNIEDSLNKLNDMDLFNDIEDGMVEDDDFMSVKDLVKNTKRREEEEEPALDDILDRISQVGFENLSDREKVLLEKYSKNS